MYINQLDEIFDNIIDKFNQFLVKKKAFDIFKKEINFVTIHNYIIDLIKEFIKKNISKEELLRIIKNDFNFKYIIEIIKRYCAFYVYLSIAYVYDGNRDLYATNIIETSKNQKDNTYQIDNFYNSDNNAKLILFFHDIKNLLSVIKLGKTMEKIKIILRNNPINFESTLNFVEDLGDDYFIQYILVNDNFHNILKTIIFRLIYLKEEKKDILSILKQEEEDNAEYKYIEVMYAKQSKIVDFTTIQKFLTSKQIRDGLAEEIYSYIQDFNEDKELDFKENEEYVQFLFTNQVVIPITDDFLRYHKDSEKYDPEALVKSNADLKERDATKIKYIINKISKVKNLYSKAYQENPKLKLEAESYFYKPLDYKQAVLYNDFEEIKIIQKLEESEKTSDLDLLGDLENIRKYAYVNFRDYKGFKFRPKEPTTCIRYSNIKNNKSKDKTVETRVGNDDIDINVNGVIWNPSKYPIECFSKDNLVDVRKVMKTKNGFVAFRNIVEKTFFSKEKYLFYWIFNPEDDIPDIKEYVNLNKMNFKLNIFTMLASIYKVYYNNVEKKLIDYLSSFNKLTIYDLDNIIYKYTYKYIDYKFDKNLFIRGTNFALLNKIPEIKVKSDDIDSQIPGKSGKIIKLPEVELEKKVENIIKVTDKVEEVIDINKLLITPVCLHYIKWENLKRMKKINTDEYSQGMFNFIKQYVTLSESNEYTCKSCGEYLNIPNNVWTGTYVKEKDEFLTTSIVVNQELDKIPKYAKFKKVISNTRKNLEKFVFTTNLTFYIGNDSIKNMRKRMILKDTIDLLLLHNDYLKEQPKDRIQSYSKKYGIMPDFTRLFFFELKDDIFVTRSDDIDQFKMVKYNNIITYLILMIVSDLNAGQIIGLKDDKICNFYRFKLLKEQIFGKLFIRINQKEKISALKLPLFCYVVYYFTCILVGNYYWLSVNNKTDKKSFNSSLHITAIHTLFDLVNSIMEANINSDNKNYLYQILATRIRDKLETLYSDTEIVKRIEEESNKNFQIDGKTIKKIVNKLPFITKDISVISQPDNKFCESTTKQLNTHNEKSYNNELNQTTNCPDGKYHIWKLEGNDLVCSLCNLKYNKLKKEAETTSSVDDYQHIINQLKFDYYKKMLNEYCISGELHDFPDDKQVCSKCKLNPFNHKYSEKEINKFEKNMEAKDSNRQINVINETKEYIKQLEKNKIKTTKILSKFEKRYESSTNNKIINYVDDFIDKITKIVGKKIKVDGKDIFLKDTKYFIDHDHLGNQKSNGFSVMESENKIIFEKKNKHVGRDVYYYKDRSKNISVFYDAVNLQYLGYFEDNKFNKGRNNTYLKITYSIRDKLKMLGLSNKYERRRNILETDDSSELINKLIEKRVLHLKYLSLRIISIIYRIRHGKKENSIYSFEEKEIVNSFIKSIRKFNVRNNEGKKAIFKHVKYILNKSPVSKVPDNINIDFNHEFIDVSIINSLNNLDTKLLFFIIYNFNRLLEYNSTNNKLSITNLIISLISYSFNVFWKPVENFNLRKFEEILIIDSDCPFLNEQNRVVSSYEDLLNTDISIDEVKELEYDQKEELDALDLDDYEDEDNPYMPESELD